MQYTSAAAERYKLQLERDLAKSKQVEAEEAAQASKAALPAELEAEPQTSSSTPAPVEKLLGNGKAPSVSNLSDAGSVTSNGATSTAAAPASAGEKMFFSDDSEAWWKLPRKGGQQLSRLTVCWGVQDEAALAGPCCAS